MRLDVQGLRCVRGGRTVLEDVNFVLAAGEAALLTGPNGAGKTTLLRTLAGLLRPAAGHIVLSGGPAGADTAEQCHYVGHLPGVKRALTVHENVAFWAGYLGRGVAPETALERVGLHPLAGVPAGLLSQGQMRRLGLARLLLARRPLWLLDEPSVSLDDEAQAALLDILSDHVRAGGLLLVASHAPLAMPFAHTIVLGGGSARP